LRVLYLTHRLPYVADRGDRIRARHVLENLAGYADVDLVSLVHDEAERMHAGSLLGLAHTVETARVSRLRGYARAMLSLATSRPLTHALLDAPEFEPAIRRVVAANRPDVVLTSSSGMAPFALGDALRDVPHVLDMVDVDSEKWRALGRQARPPLRWVYATEGRRLSAFEAAISRQTRAVLVINERERDALLRLAPQAPVHVVPVGVAVETFTPPGEPAAAPVINFCGVMNYAPNEQGMVWFSRDVWPQIRTRHPGAQLSIVGSSPTEIVRGLAADPTITVTGRVADVRPYLWASAVSVAPLFVARGTQNKVLEAIAAGLPCVVTPEVHAGLPAEARAACVVASSAEAFTDAVVRLLTLRPDERRAMAHAAELDALTWSRQLQPLQDILRAILSGA
jgi:sugar transferase (PEP-CTERM/EpsH1 system associated)